MQLNDRSLSFSKISSHANVTQCLGSIGGNVWYLGVAKPSIVDPADIKGVMGAEIVQSHCGHFYEVQTFRISGPKFIKLNNSTWDAGPLFTYSTINFYNLESQLTLNKLWNLQADTVKLMTDNFAKVVHHTTRLH
ncbi:hypothetical protein K7X08_024111 [Anisodus acutangulus]|uniref:Uncharacterized protein n=1 Tax=Anisodus acutangulus TaxID=402998 RepID=A0A9Q1RFP1_9SOLA|nr:hypothetical protein K7X08_024111 [Anisodus acutangulus]